MVFRGVYRDGAVYLEDASGLRNGTRVEISAVKRLAPDAGEPTGRKGQKRSRSGRVSKAPVPPLPGFGSWKRRKDITDSAALARKLRRKVSTRGRSK